jgi:hypothetical protein
MALLKIAAYAGGDDLVDLPPHPGIHLHSRGGEQPLELARDRATNKDIDSQTGNESRPLRET